MLRDHPLFHFPLPIDVKKTVAVDTPDVWKKEVRAPKVEVVPLARDAKAPHSPGWCTYTYEHEGAPELEVLCGGLNHKTPRAGAIWRQGTWLGERGGAHRVQAVVQQAHRRVSCVICPEKSTMLK